MKTLFVRLLAVIFLLQLNARAAILDTTFNPGSGANGIVEQVLPLADGRILICGNFTTFNGASRPYIARLNSDGSLDNSFFGQPSYWVRHMSVQSDGKIVIGGFFKGVQGVPCNLIARLNSDGSLDSSFNPGAGCEVSLGTAIDGNVDPFVFWTEVQPDGKILITGNFRNYNGASSTGMVRVNADGSRDTSFNVGGGLDSWGRHIEVQSNGQILLAGWFTQYNGRGFNRLARINPDGSPDTSFNPFFGDKTAIYSTKQLSDGKYIVVGHSLNEQGLFKREMARLNQDGSQDASFVGYTNEKTESVAVAPDGKIYIGGYFNNASGATKQSVARLFPDGSVDTSWGASIDNYVWTVALDRNGKLLISGGFYTVDGASRNGVARLLTGGTATPPPAAPSLSASLSGATSAQLAWSDVANDRSGYTVERKVNNGAYATIATLGATARSYLNSGLSAGATYTYRLRATTTSGSATYSNESSVTTPASEPGSGSGGVTFVGSARTTGGSWKGAYGSEGYSVFSDATSIPAYAAVTPTGKSDWIWQYSTADARALQRVSATERLAACYYSGSPFSISVAIKDGSRRRVSLYLLDWDNGGRSTTVRVIDPSGAALHSQTVSSFSGGIYLTYDITGNVRFELSPVSGNAVVSGLFFGGSGGGTTTPQKVATPTFSPAAGTYSGQVTVSIACATPGAEIRYTFNGTTPTTSSALYTGPFVLRGSTTVRAKAFKSGMTDSDMATSPYTISTATSSGANWVFAGADSNTGGSWMGKYGADGYFVLPNTSKYPTYSNPTATGKSDWLWAWSTTDTRALQLPGSTARTAGCWYSSTSFTIDVRITDGQTHRVALYFCDWDSGGRNQTVELINGDTGAVVNIQSLSGFSAGRYLMWDLKGNFKIRVTNKLAGGNAVLNGLFFGPAAQQL